MGHPAHNNSLTDLLRDIESEIAAGRAESALPRCQEIVSRYPRALAAQRVLGEIYLALRKPREALAALDRALTGDPEDARACCARAIVHQMHGDQLAALSWYRRACDIRPEDTTLRATYQEMAARLGQPPYQPGRAGLARLYLRGDLFTHAIREWETLIAENSDSTRLEAHAGLVETLWRAGRTQEAEAWARRTLTNAPSCLKPLLIAAVVAHDDGRDADAEPFLRRAADLDPDHRIARALFADRLGAGDTELSVLIWGETPPDSSAGGAAGGGPASDARTRVSHGPAPTSGQRATHPAERRINRPLVTGPLTTPPRTRPDLTAPPASPLPPPTSRPNELPPNFHSMFKETEGMLWNPGDSDPDALRDTVSRPVAPAPPPAPSPAPPPEPVSFEAPPPAIAESSFALGDTEMRRAIRWVQWLQAQGARSLGEEPERGRPSGSLDALFNNPPSAVSQPMPSAQPFANEAPPVPPVVSLPSMPSRPSDSMTSDALPPFADLKPPSGPLPPPLSADLRQMFAELEPGAGERNAAEATASPIPPTAPDETPAEPAPPSAAPSEWAMSLAEALSHFDDSVQREAPGMPTASAPSAPPPVAPSNERDDHIEPVRAIEPIELMEPIESLPTGPITPPAASAAPAWPAEPAEPARATEPAAPAPDSTIEELERMGMADGFTPFTIQPGALAAIAGEAGPSTEAESGADWLETRAPAPSEAPEPPALARQPEEPALPREPLEPAPPLPAAEPPIEPPLASQPAGPDPHDYAARLQQARAQRDSGALDEAIIEYRTVVRNAPELLPDVLSDVERCLAERPEHPELHRLLGDARIRQGDYLGALESYNRAVALSQSLDI